MRTDCQDFRFSKSAAKTLELPNRRIYEGHFTKRETNQHAKRPTLCWAKCSTLFYFSR